MKRFLTLATLYTMLVLLTSCSSGMREYAWVLGTASPENTVTGIFAESFAANVDSLSRGRLKVRVYHNSLLGGDTELIESCQCGDIPFVVQNTAPEVSYMKRLCLFDLPCAFDSLEALHQVLDSDGFMERVNQIYRDAGFSLLAMADQGFRVMTANREITGMDSFRGIKIRTMENSYHMDFWSAIGANPTPMSFAELYVGLEQHTVDAQENPYEVICSNAFYEVQDYVIDTRHLPHLLALVVNDDFLQGLPEVDRSIVEHAAALARDTARTQASLRAGSRMAEILESGSQIIPVSEDLRQKMREASSSLYERIRSAVADDDLFHSYISQSSDRSTASGRH